ncbi:MAG: alpha-galactosidase [Gammaproteobacteria bacterium]|nr:MAG: alpha-galactosidase [Gammaproteobacteria bacterium]
MIRWPTFFLVKLVLALVLAQSYGLGNAFEPTKHARTAPHFSTGTPGFVIWDSRNIEYEPVNSAVPFSFTYNGIPFNQNTWQMLATTPTNTIYRDPSNILEVQFTQTLMADFNAVKWAISFRNVSTTKVSGIIAQVKSADIQLIHELGSTERYVINYSTGSLGEEPNDGSLPSRDLLPVLSDFTPIRNAPPKTVTVALRSSNGRSSSQTLPYFNVEAPGGGAGVVFAIGWSGQWASSFAIDSTGTDMRFQAGQEDFGAQLRPGEHFRAPSTLMMPWKGKDFLVGQNKFRQLMLKYFSPRDSQRQLPKPIAAASSAGLPIAWERLTSEDLIKAITHVAKSGISLNTFWQDAGWYRTITKAQDPSLYDALTKTEDKLWISGVGDWIPDPDRFPKGYGEVSQKAHELGLKSLLWFEPERMASPAINFDSWNDGRLIHRSRSLCDTTCQKLYRQVNFSDRSVVDQLLALLDTQIKAGKIDIFRMDSNGDGPHLFWKNNDAKQKTDMGIERTGISEASHIDNLYYFWDHLRARHPGMIIDNCAAGGRRLDFEALSRTVPLWRSDRVDTYVDTYMDNKPITEGGWGPTEQQNQMLGLSLWLPLQGRGADASIDTHEIAGLDGFKYRFRSGAGWSGVYALNWHNLDPDQRRVTASETGWLFGTKSPLGPMYPAAEMFKGDFYPMPYGQIDVVGKWQGSMPTYIGTKSVWVGWQLHRPDLKMGLVQAFRRSIAAPGTYSFVLQGLDATATYLVTDIDASGSDVSILGATLMSVGLQMSCSGACSKVYTLKDISLQ